MEIYTIGFTQTTAERFFERLAAAGVVRLLDVRLNNTSQLAGFAKAADLPYFLRELIGASYEHEPLLAPTKELLDGYKKRKGDWRAYEAGFLALMGSREIEHALDRDDFDATTALLCSEATAEHCHRRTRGSTTSASTTRIRRRSSGASSTMYGGACSGEWTHT